MKTIALLASLLIPAAPMLAEKAQERLKDASEVFSEITATPDKGIPTDLLEKAHCAVIVPGLKKAAFGVGGQYGRGFIICRQADGTGWGPPGAVRIEGGSFGFQIGGSSTDVVMLVMNRRGMNKLLESKFTVGADATAAAGPVGRSASADMDAQLTAEILSWSRSKGAFAGISLEGATLRNDLDENAELYGKKINNKEVVASKMSPPAAAQPLLAQLNKYSFREDKSSADRQATSGTSKTKKKKSTSEDTTEKK